ncbi:TonB-dependent receptor [Flaviaesturariibacter terrae]
MKLRLNTLPGRRSALLRRLAVALLLALLLPAAASAGAQNKLTLALEKADLRQALQLIEQQSAYRFFYNETIIAGKPPVTLNVRDAELRTVLDQLLPSRGISYRLLDNNVVVLQPEGAPRPPADRPVSGRVTNAAGQPLPGVSVTVPGGRSGTTTDVEGRFSLNVPDGVTTLTFSYVGYLTQTVAIGSSNEVNVTLAVVENQLESVVVVGYGTQRKRDVTGSVSNVSGKELARQPVLTATQGMQGKVAGVQIISSGAPNSAPVVRIRGTGSILGGVNPLYVVDGVITDDIRNINNADITSVDVLKDASAAAIYGVRAANGVILITTRKGRVGRLSTTYDASVGMRQASHLVKMANSQQYATYINEASVNTGNGDVLVDPAAVGTNTDWFGTILRNAFYQNHNLSVSGGTDQVTYFLSAGYLADEGIVLNSKFRRFTIRSNNDYKLSDKFRISSLISFANARTQDVNLGAAYNNAYHAAPIIASKIGSRYGNTSAYQNVGNPLLDIENNDNIYAENRFQGTVALDFKPVSWLTFRTSFGVDLLFNNRTAYNKQFGNDTVTFLVAGGNQRNEKSLLTVANERYRRWVWDNTATAQRTFGRSDFTLLVGTTAERALGSSDEASRNGVPADPNLRYLSQGDESTQKNNSFAFERTRTSYIARLSYAYNRKYLVTGTFRADGTSQFTEKYSYSPAIGLGWVISNEPFMTNQKLFSYLKLRASHGKLGNDNVPLSASVQTIQNNLPYFFNGVYNSGINYSTFVDKNIRWESTTETDLGLDFTVKGGRLTGEVDVYRKQVKDALILVPILIGSQTYNVFTNLASIDNKGVELALNWQGQIAKKVSYTLGINGSFNQNNVVALRGGQAVFSGFVGSKGSTTATNNDHPISSFYMLEADGVFHNQKELADYVTSNGTPITINGQPPTLGDLRYVDQNGDGKIDDNDRIYAGSYLPKVTLGLNSSFTYKNFDLSIAIYSALGSKIYNGKKAARFNQRDNVEASVADDRWTFSNYASDVPRANLNALPHSTYFLESGSFARINNLTLGYTVSGDRWSRWGVKGLRVYVTAQNLATFTKYSGFTPELASADPLSQGIELNAYPTTRTYAFGVNLNF